MKKANNKRSSARIAFLAMLLALTVFPADGTVYAAEKPTLPETLIPVGHTVGIKLFADGVLVVGLAELETETGTAAPGRACGLKVGDMILQADGVDVESTEHFQTMLQQAGDKTMELQVKRGNRLMELPAASICGEDGVWRLGAWIRDSLAGIGTMTFYDPASGVFGALGHGINDVDTMLLMPLEAGAIMDSTVKTVKRGAAGEPGELKGDFDLTTDRGVLYANTDCGVFGTMDACALTEREALPVARANEVKVGKATILSNISGDAVEEYTVEIEKICNLRSDTQNFLVRATDPRLLTETGGIVQGMSGSPILQNGRIVGAVTHVMVDDPTRGYGIFIENMLEAAEIAG